MKKQGTNTAILTDIYRGLRLDYEWFSLCSSMVESGVFDDVQYKTVPHFWSLIYRDVPEPRITCSEYSEQNSMSIDAHRVAVSQSKEWRYNEDFVFRGVD